MAKTFSMEQLIPYSSHISPEIIKIKGGSYLMTAQLKGVSYIGKSQDEIDTRVVAINKFISQLRAPYRYNIYVQSHCIHHDSLVELKDTFEKDSFADLLNRDYIEQVINGEPVIMSDYYISIIYRPYRRIGRVSAVKTTKKEIAEFEKQATDVLSALKDKLLSTFAEYDLRILSYYQNENDIIFSEQLEFFNRIINLTKSKIPVMRAQISEYLATATLTLGKNEIMKVETGTGKTQYATVLTISEYPDSTITGQLQRFLELPWRMIVTQTFAPIDKTEASDWLGREYKRLENMDSGSAQDLDDLIEAREGVRADNFVLGEFYWSATIIADSAEELRQKIGQANAILNDCGLTVSANRVAKLHSYFAQLPGNISLQPRSAKLSSLNTAQMMPYQIQNRGKQWGNPWGCAVSMLRTVSDEVFFFNFHDSDAKIDNEGDRLPGNTVISGQTGAGKTVLLSFLLAQAQRYPTRPKTIIFDKDLGSSVFVKALGGQYSEIKLGESTGFNPFHLPNNDENITFLNELILTILNSDGMSTPTAAEKNEIDTAIRQTISAPKHLADIESFANYLPDGDNSIRQRLHPWTTGRYSWVFNNPTDNFSLDSHIIGIDYTQFLDIKDICTPILMYLFHRIQLMIDGNPMIISMDEAWKPLRDKRFQTFIEDKERTIRKENGILILATQSPGDFINNVSESLMGQITTQIFLPNPKAHRDDYLGKLGLDESEYKIIKEMPIRSREFLIKYQGETIHCKLNLKGIRAVEVMSGSEDRARLADLIINDFGQRGNWLTVYYQVVEYLKRVEKTQSKQSLIETYQMALDELNLQPTEKHHENVI